jgi:hypothetical protein
VVGAGAGPDGAVPAADAGGGGGGGGAWCSPWQAAIASEAASSVIERAPDRMRLSVPQSLQRARPWSVPAGS